MRANTVPDLFRQSKEEWLDAARHHAQSMLMVRRTITIEDVLRDCPLPSYLRRDIIGKVFQNVIFHPVGYTTSKSPAAHKHVIRIWQLKDEYFDPKMINRKARHETEYENE